jgi:hypothetical protein
VPVALGIGYRAWRYRVTGGNPVSKRTKKDGVKPVSPKGTFLSRIAVAKKKLAHIQKQIDAPFTKDETRDMNALYRQIDPAIDGVFREFCALISPDGFEVSKANKGWLIQEKDEKPEPKKKQPKKAKRLSKQQTRTAINAIRKQMGADNHSIEWAQRHYDALLALNEAERKPHLICRTTKKNIGDLLQTRIQHKETEEQMAKITHLASDEEGSEAYTMCTRKGMRMVADVAAVECEECRAEYESRKGFEAMRPVHAVGNKPGSVRCSSRGSHLKVADGTEKVTCQVCLRGLDQDEQLAMYPLFTGGDRSVRSNCLFKSFRRLLLSGGKTRANA